MPLYKVPTAKARRGKAQRTALNDAGKHIAPARHHGRKERIVRLLHMHCGQALAHEARTAHGAAGGVVVARHVTLIRWQRVEGLRAAVNATGEGRAVVARGDRSEVRQRLRQR